MKPSRDIDFEIRFYERVLRRDPKFVDVIEILGGHYTRRGRISDGLRMDRRLVRLRPGNATAHYNLACSLALSNRPTAALQSLQQAIHLGYDDYDWMRQDPDLKGLKDHPVFQTLLTKLQPQS